MEKDFLSLKTDPKKLSIMILCAGFLITLVMAIGAYRESKFQNGYELLKKEAGEGAYEQDVIAQIEDMGEIPLTVTVEEKVLTKDEAEQFFKEAVLCLDELLLGKNESFEKIKEDLCLVNRIPEIPVEVTWMGDFFKYFYSDGTIREDVLCLEAVELKLSAVLSCQEYTKDYEKIITLLPRKSTAENVLLKKIYENEEENIYNAFLKFPEEYEGKRIVWRKPLDRTFLYIGFLTIGALLFLKEGRKRDEKQEKRKRLEEMEKDYAQVVSKFSMLLMAGLSVRNAWERIVRMDRKGQRSQKAISEEMSWALRELQKGIPELEVYECFGRNVGLVHYKKLMAMFVSYKRRGGNNLLELMNQEMLLAWEEKKRKTRQQGEIIGTKLLLPMMGMLAIVFIMILVPAFLSFQL